MKNLILIVSIMLCGSHIMAQKHGKPVLITLQQVERILGEPAVTTLSEDTSNVEVYFSKSEFHARSVDHASNKTGAFAYIYEDYNSESEAWKTYRGISLSNEKSPGFEKMNNFGDEAFYHSDGRNFYLIFARKGNKILRMKVNKITSKTSLAEFRKVAQELMLNF